VKEVLYISYDGMTDPLPQSQVLPYLEGLCKEGFSFTILSCEKADAYAQHASIIEQRCAKSQIRWNPIIYHQSPPVLSTIYDVLKLRSEARRLHRLYHFSIVHCRSYIPALIGLHMKRKCKVPFIFDMRGFWADERVDGALWKLSNPLYKTIYQYFKNKERDFFRESDHSISLTFNGKEEIARLYDTAEKKIPVEVIPCCVDTDMFNPANINPAQIAAYRKDLGISPDDYIVSYVGSVGTWYLLPEMLAFFKRLRLKEPRAKFLFITASDASLVKDACAAAGVSTDMIFITKGKRDEMPTLISLSNISLFFIKPAYSKKASSPTKQAEIMSLGIPIVCNPDVGDTERVINQYEAGVVIQAFDEASYDDGINSLMTSTFDKKKIRTGALEFYELGQGTQRYLQVYKDIISSN